MKNNEVDIAIIGGGIMGACVAERLLHEGHQVTLIDKRAATPPCSHGNAGHFATDIVLPLANFSTILALPRLLADPLGPLSIRWRYLPRMLPWLLRFTWAAMPHKAKATMDALSALNRPSIEHYQRLLTRIGAGDLMVQRGAITVYEQAASQVKNQATLKILREYSIEVQELPAAALRELEPALATHVQGGLYFPNTAHTVNPARLHESIVASLVARGGVLRRDEIHALERQNGGQIKLHGHQGTLLAKRVVIAAGAWSKPLVKMTGFNVPLDTERGYHLMLPQPQIHLTRPLTSFERSFVMTPMEHGVRLAGTVELGGLEAAMNPARADILYTHASKLLPGLQRDAAQRWMGFRPSLPDSLPVIGCSPHDANIFYAFGHQHLGLTQAAVTAELIADQIAGRDSAIDTKPYRVNRF